jgi:hypothetical protein
MHDKQSPQFLPACYNQVPVRTEVAADHGVL